MFFIDECIKCSAVYDALQLACLPGETIQVAQKGRLDEEWLVEAGQAGWLCLSKDRQMMKNPAEMNAIVRSQVGLFTLGEASGAKHAEIISSSLKTVRRVARLLNCAFVAKIEPDGSIAVRMRDGERLERAHIVKPKLGERPGK